MFSIMEINNVLNGIIHHNNEKVIDSVSINSNNIQLNTVFIPIIGEKHDGHNFILDSIKNGAIACLMSSNFKDKNNIINYCKNNDISLIEVNNTLSSLENLAAYNRNKNISTKVIAITGSNGKTTSKEIVYDVLKNDYNVLKTEGNLNNNIGVSLTLLQLNKHDIAIIEMGMNNLNEISKLSIMAKPNIGIITNIGSAHIGNLGSIDNILKAKLEIIDGFNKDSILLLNKNDKILKKIKIKNKKIDHYYTDNNIVGDYTDINKALALKIADIFNVNNPIEYIDNFTNPSMRNEIINIKDKIIINDCYNANYESMTLGIKNIINKYKNYHILLFLGEIKEIGEYSKLYHSKIGKLINKSNIDILYLIGNDTLYIKREIKSKKIKVINYKDYTINCLYADIFKYNNTIIYFKGSRSNKIDIIVNELIELINRS